MTNRLEHKLNSGDFVVTSELTPPKGIDLTDLIAKAELLKPCVDAMNLTESPRARMAIEPKSVARLLIERGVEPIVQVTARDRNRIAVQADLLGASLLGVCNFVFMTGDSPKNGDHPDAKPVFDLTTVELLEAARALAGGHDLAGNPLKGTPHLFVGATANPGAPDQAKEIEGTRRKVEAGARFLQTQAVFDVGALKRYLEGADLGSTKLLAGIIPLKSAKMAGWLNGNVPGIRVPQELIEEMQEAAKREREVEAGIEIAVRLIRGLKGVCAGVHVMALGWEAHVPQILRESAIR
jgi:methylenetetrahydrofolate reductase (NADH)